MAGRREIDDGQASVAESQTERLVDPDPGVVRPAVGQRGQHPLAGRANVPRPGIEET
jgi:hypothetical protein